MQRGLSWALDISLVDKASKPLLAFARQNERVQQQVERATKQSAAVVEKQQQKTAAAVDKATAAVRRSAADLTRPTKAWDQLTAAEKRAEVAHQKVELEMLKVSKRAQALSGDLARAEKAQARQSAVVDQAAKRNGRLSAGLGRLAKQALAVGSAYASIQGIRNAVTATEDLGKATIGLTNNFGLATDEASRWAAQEKIRGIGIKALSTSFSALTKNMTAVTAAERKRNKQIEQLGSSEADQKKKTDLASKSLGAQADVFKRLGITTSEVQAGQKDFGGFLERIADGMANVSSKSERNALGLKLFGRQWQTLRPLLSGGSAALREQLDMADKYGLTMSEANTKGLGEMIAAQREFKFALLGVEVQLGKALMPLLTRAAKKFADISASVRKNWPEIKKDIQPVVDVLKSVGGVLASIVTGHPRAVAGLLAVGAAVKAIKFAGAISGASTLLGLMGKMRGASAGAATAQAAAGAGAVGKAGRLSRLASKLSRGVGIAGVGVLGAQGAGALIGGGTGKTVASVGSGAALGAAAGSMVSPVVGTIVGGILGGVAGAFKRAGAAKAEAAARSYTVQVTQRIGRVTAAGFKGPAAQGIGRAQATLKAGADARQKALEAQRTGDFGLLKDAQRDAKAAGLDLGALVKGNSAALMAAGKDAVRFFEEGIKTSNFTSRTVLADKFVAATRTLPPALKQQAGVAMLEYARGLERNGQVARGTVEKLSKQFGIIVPGAAKAGRDAVAALDRNLNDRRLAASAERLIKSLPFDQIPKLAVRTVPGAVASLRSSLSQLEAVVRSKDASKRMKEQAEASMPKVRQAYDDAIRKMAKRLGVSEDQVRSWADKVDRAAGKAGRSSGKVAAIRDAVRGLGSTMDGSAQAALRFQDAIRELDRLLPGLQAGLNSIAQTGLPGTSGLATLPKKGKRSGGLIQRFAGGGLVPSMVSSGEALRFPNGQWAQVPGAPVAADNVFAPLPVGTEVYTGHGQQLLAAGASRAAALREQMPHFAKGGFVSTAYGPPWNSMNGSGITSTGIKLANAPTGKPGPYIVAVDPRVIPLHSKLGIWPNPFGYRGKFAAEDVGGAIKGNRIDFLDMIGRKHQMAWGRRNVSVGTPTQAGAKGTSGTSGSSTEVKVPRTLGRSLTRARNAASSAFEAGYDTGLSRAQIKAYGNPYLAQLRQELDDQRASYSKTVTVKTPGSAGKGASASKAGAAVGMNWRPGMNTLAWGKSFAKRFGLRISSTYRTPAHNAAVGGVQNSLHTHGSMANPGAIDFVPPKASALSWAKRHAALREGLIHDAGSGLHLHLGFFRRGGRAMRNAMSRFASGGIAGGSSLYRPSGSVKRALSAVGKSTTDRNLERLDDVIGTLGASRLNSLSDYLSTLVNKAGDAKAKARVEAALKVVSAEAGRRTAEMISKSAGRLDALQSRIDSASTWRQAFGVDADSIAGRTAAIGDTQRAFQGANSELSRLQRDREQTLKNVKGLTPATRQKALAALDEQIKVASGKVQEWGESLALQSTELDRMRPQLQGAENLAHLDFLAAMASRTASGADDAEVERKRREELERQLQQALAQGAAGEAWATQLIGELQQNTSALQELKDQQQRDTEMQQQALDQQAKLIHLIQTESGALPAALASFANDGMGRRLAASMSTSVVPGEKWRF